ncbi:hypothetical protein CHISP_0838 [Chitinispirillum alkaliphilum]|nr:hypothetical protein CHISP_0838 [Chitinispirillum alkaliphilum]
MLLFLIIFNVVSKPEHLFRVNSFSLPQDSDSTSHSLLITSTPHPPTRTDQIPNSLNPGEILKRKKENGTYTLKTGKIDTSAFSLSPTIYHFEIPRWSSLAEIARFRFYRSPTDNQNLDTEVIYFDNEHIYSVDISTLYFMRRGEWESINGTRKSPTGSLHLHSTPAGADVYFFGEFTGFQTPCTIDGLIAGNYEIELFLPNYRFIGRNVKVLRDTLIRTSFELLSDFDPIHIIGEKTHGKLILPHPPVNSPFKVNDSVLHQPEILLMEGEHSLKWNGGNLYREIDTTLFIKAGELHYFNVPYERLHGTININAHPEEMLICIDGRDCHTGNSSFTLPTGFYTLRASKSGYLEEKRKILISPDVQSRISVILQPNLDRDGDGFPDSIDRCPDVYGLFMGCPRMRFTDAFAIKLDEVREYVQSDSLTFGISVLGTVSRFPGQKEFADFLTSFSSGRFGGINNYRGLSSLNKYQLSWRGLQAQLELGQWASGLRFKRSDTLTLQTKNDTYYVYHDSLNNIEPAIYIPSTAVSLGMRYKFDNFSIAYSLGYQWENIIVDQLISSSDGSLHEVRFSNNWWFHQLTLTRDLVSTATITPSVYCQIKFPFGPVARTRWYSLQTGLQINYSPSWWREK